MWVRGFCLCFVCRRVPGIRSCNHLRQLVVGEDGGQIPVPFPRLAVLDMMKEVREQWDTRR